MRIAVTGSTGLLGTALVGRLSASGHSVTRVVRGTSPAGPGVVRWDPARGEIEAAGLEDHDAVIHLAGESVGGRWTAERKRRIFESRVAGTALLAGALTRLRRPPRVLISQSAIGYYGYRDPDEPLDEQARPGTAYISEVVAAWEGAAAPAADAGIRVVTPRTGLVLSPLGGYLGRLLPLFRLGLGGRFGGGRQAMSWIALDDVPSVMLHILERDSLSGPVNVVSPHAVTNAEFTRILGQALGRPAILPLPGFAARLLFGEMADALLLGGARVIPKQLGNTGYRFAYPRLDQALQHLLSPPTGHRSS